MTTRTVLITGGSRGIGAAMVRAFASRGQRAFFSYRVASDKALSLEKELAQQGHWARSIQADFGTAAGVEGLLTEIVGHDIDILINNAAVLHYCDFWSVGLDVWDETQAVNLLAPTLLAQRLMPRMMEKGWGRVINMASIGGQWGGTLAVPYAVSKAALIGLTRSLAKLAAKSGVTANAIAPGLVATEIIQGEMYTEEFEKKVASIPVGRIADVDEVVQVALFLASDAASYITGQTINVNGGMYFT